MCADSKQDKKKDKKKGSEEVGLSIEDGVAYITLGASGESIPVLSERRIKSLAAAIESLRTKSELKAVIFLGNESGFCAGADIGAIRAVKSAQEGEQLAKIGQKIFDAVSALNAKTVAVIHGACTGGGCELSLACDYRVITDAPKSSIGLPETRLGIVPGFGGTQRLPRLIGVRKALDIILGGKLLPPRQAISVGLVDYVLPIASAGSDIQKIFEELKKLGRDIALGRVMSNRREPSLIERLVTKSGMVRNYFVKSNARASVLKKTKGFYPAQLRALDVIFLGLEQGQTRGLAEEAKAIGELVVTSECKALVHLYELKESAKGLGRAAKEDLSRWTIGVVGAGVMGSGIASSFLTRGFSVLVLDPQEAARERCRAHVTANVERRRELSAEAKKGMLDRLQLVEKVDQLGSCNIVIEAALENMDLKKELFGRLSQIVTRDAILATNTSSLSITEIASACTVPERVIGMHFFNPVERMPLVELVRGRLTNEKTTVCVAKLSSILGKDPIVVEDVPGFLVNRILTPYMVEAAQLLFEGVSVEAIDRAAVSFGMPMGPIYLLDEVGLDVAAKVAEILGAAYGDRMKGPQYAKQLTSLGRLGKKSGFGFYRHEGELLEVDPSLRSTLGIGASIEMPESEIRDRLILSMVNEAVRCLDDGVAGMPSADASGQIDLGTAMGTGFPAFRGGLMHYAESLGVQKLAVRLGELAKSSNPRFTPAPGILARAESKRSLYESVGLQ